MTPLRILFLGENWFGSCARACCYALRRLGHDVIDVDSQTFFPHAHDLGTRATLRLLRPRLVREYNRRVVEVARSFRPDLLLAFKGTYVRRSTLAELRGMGIRLYNYFPDRVALYLDAPLGETIPEYDCFFDTKRSWDGDAPRRIRAREVVFVPHGYDPELHRRPTPSAREAARFAADVSFIGNHSPLKEELLAELVRIRPGLGLRIWGHGWRERFAGSPLGACVAGKALIGADYVRAIAASRVNLAIMGVVPEARDETTTRTYEIPACGGFMLHERSDEVLGLFEEGREVACFGSARELADKIDHYLAHPDERAAIARGGHARCVPAYSYDNRMAEIVRWHLENGSGGGLPDSAVA